MAKYFHGQLGNLDTYVHICYIASLTRCAFGGPSDEEASMRASWSFMLAFCSILALIFSNLKRMKFIWDHKMA